LCRFYSGLVGVPHISQTVCEILWPDFVLTIGESTVLFRFPEILIQAISNLQTCYSANSHIANTLNVELPQSITSRRSKGRIIVEEIKRIHPTFLNNLGII
jgi:hypothetical protein